MRQKTKKLSFRVENSAQWKTATISFDASLSSLIGLEKKKNSVSCSEFHLVQNGLNLRKMHFSVNFPSSHTNVSISPDFGNVKDKAILHVKNKAILKLKSHLIRLISLLSLKINQSWLWW